MANSSISISSIVVTSVISVSVAVSSVSATATFPDASVGVSVTGQTINASYFIVPTTVLPEQRVNVIDTESYEDGVGFRTKLTKAIDSVKVDEALPSDSDPIFNAQLVKADSVTMVESRVKVFTDFIDFDPTDDDVDATPVTIDESAAFDLSKSFTGADDVTPSESIAKAPNKPGITASVSTSEAINQLRPHKNVTDTATTSEAIDRFDVTTELTDTVSVTEATAKSFTVADPDDSVTAVQSNIKAFTSNIDFDLSDADVDPDPVTATEQINIFALDKGLTDTASVTEATAKTVGNNSLADTASPVEAAVFNTTKPAIADTLTAVEGIKNTPNKNVSTPVGGFQTLVVTVVQSGGNKFAIDGVTAPALTLIEGVTYIFDVSDNSNSGHPLRFKDASGNSYSAGVTVHGTQGQSGATVIIAVPLTGADQPARYYCTVHGNGMGNAITTQDTQNTQTFAVTVVQSGGNKFAIDGVTNPTLTLVNGFIYTFDVSDSSNSGHPLRFKDAAGDSYSTGVTVNGTQGQSGATVVIAVSSSAPAALRYYCTVHGNGMGNTIDVPNSSAINQVLAVESAVLNIQQAFSHTASVTESINTSLILGETEHLYPEQVFITAIDSNPTSIRGYHRGLNEGSDSGSFVQDSFRFRKTDFTGILGQDDSLLNLTPIHQDTQDGIGRDTHTGVIGSAGLINQLRINGQTITYGQATGGQQIVESAGLLVNFIYTDTDDTELNGHFLNETPLCAGSYV
jgi:hypothetical protein